MSSAAVPNPLLEFQRTDRPARLVETRVSADTIIPVVPWLAKYDRRLTVDDYIASYLGIKPQSLSRIKKELSKKS